MGSHGVHLTEEARRELWRALCEPGTTARKVGRSMGISDGTVYAERRKLMQAGLEAMTAAVPGGGRGLSTDVHATLQGLGLGDLRGQHSGWVHREDPETGEWASVYYLLGKDGRPQDMRAAVAEAVAEGLSGQPLARPVRPKAGGAHLLILDPADVHIGKLSVPAETGHSYDRAEAARRLRDGAAAILARAQAAGLERIVLVLGNDCAHIDNARRATTSGTPQDTDGTVHQILRDTIAAYRDLVEMCRRVAPVTLIHCPSNHDWVLGYAVSQAVAAYYHRCPEVQAAPYYLSERHRKYLVWGGALLGFTHGDGAKEADLQQLMLSEQAQWVGQCAWRYWYTHHLHHKVRKVHSGRLQPVERDHAGMTIVGSRGQIMLGDTTEIEVLRSPSPPDGWHDRNGYLNRQAIEAYLHEPGGAQVARLTEWV